MTDVPRGLPLRSHTGAPYRFDAGALCLELLTTGGPGAFRRYEVLREPADVVAWAERSRLAPTPELAVTEEEVARARRLRDALWHVVLDVTGTEPPPDPDSPSAPPSRLADAVATLNEAAAEPPLAPALGPGLSRAWAAGPASGTRLLATVARDAVELLTGPFAHRIRACAADDCYLTYVDTSRPGRRRWCSMEHCGNRHKVRTHRARRVFDHIPATAPPPEEG
ncbi:CGNR zinc finger domain-containing protein [Streptomyces sp. 4N509B]|uniref:CGNR zinc finger domain-containing protein n=1 Tax=Streptomyces sp. 4N509B TaxID=3457413 RepID=UPI003FD1A291